jgi:hypothetical protein
MKTTIGLVIFLSLMLFCKDNHKNNNADSSDENIKQNLDEIQIYKDTIGDENITIDIEYLTYTGEVSKEIDTTVIYNNIMNLYLVRKSFDPKNHLIDKSQSTIDGKTFFGTDRNLPKYELSEAYVIRHNKKIQLNTSRMYNPWFGEWGPGFTLIQKNEVGHSVFTTLSDGVGAYAVEWLISENSSKRLNLSYDEKFLLKYK